VVADLIDERDEVTGAFAVRKPDITSEVDSLHVQPA
jgi:hypothetical protein